MACCFVATSGTVMTNLYTISMSPAVTIWVKVAVFPAWLSGVGRCPGLRWLLAYKDGVGRRERCDASCKTRDICCESCVVFNQLCQHCTFGRCSCGQVVKIAIQFMSVSLVIGSGSEASTALAITPCVVCFCAARSWRLHAMWAMW